MTELLIRANSLPHKPGIYFGMDQSEYLSDPSIGSGGIKDLLVSPLHFWRRSHMNTERIEEEDTIGREFGTAMHARLLEGREVFRQRYAARLSRDDFPDALDGADDLRQQCKDLGLKANGGIADLCDRIAEKAPNVILWRNVLAAHAHEHTGKTLMSVNAMERIEASAKVVESHPDVSRALSGGYPEVSIFWVDEETGVPCKARVDYLKPRVIVDLKSFSNARNKPVDRAIADVVAAYGYHMQAVHYGWGLAAVQKALLSGEAVMPEKNYDARFMDALMMEPEHPFVFVFMESCAHPSLRIKRFDRLVEGSKTEETIYWQTGAKKVREAFALYAECMRYFGTDKPWADIHPMTSFDERDFPLWAQT